MTGVELFNGTPNGYSYRWDLIYSWQPRCCDDYAYSFLPVCVISLQPGSNSLLITWIERLYTEYCEGMGSLYLEYNLENGEIERIADRLSIR